MSQKKDIKRQKARLEALKKEAEEERQRAQAEARARVLKEFERGQLGLGQGGVAATKERVTSEEKSKTSEEISSNQEDNTSSECSYSVPNLYAI